MRSLCTLAVALALVIAPFAFPSPVTAATGIYYFHGQPTDQADKAAALVDDTAVAGPTFNQTPPTGLVPVTQTTTPVANQDFVGNPLTAYWHGAFSGTISGQLQLDWWWTVPSPAGTSVSVTVFADPTYANPRGQPEKVIGRGVVPLAGGAAVENHGTVFVQGTVARELLIQVAATSLVTGEGLQVHYDAIATPSQFKFVDAAIPAPPTVVFDTTTSLGFAPATTVSAHFLGAEPQTTMERRVAGSQAGRIDPNRVFVDWPLSSRTGTGQLSRSLNGGDSFRLLYDRTCAERNRPQCLTHGGGDTEEDVNLITGDLFFADQEVVANEALVSSTDHGDSFPAARQYPISNAASGVDRQWLAWIDPSIVQIGGQPIEAFLSYHVPLAGVYIQGITLATGTPVPQALPQLLDVSQSSNLRVDNTSGPARGWIYVPYRNGSGFQVASANATGYTLPGSWQSNLVSTDQPAVFPWLNLDARGNLYAVWVTNGIVYLSVSPIGDARNDPSRGGRPATFWTGKVRVSLPAVGSAVFPVVTAGSVGRIAIGYVGSTDCVGVSDGCSNDAHWNTYSAILTDALALARGVAPTVTSGLVSHRVIHRGQVCTGGTTCAGDRSLLDTIDIGFDESGRVGIVSMDNNNGLAAEPRTNPSKAGSFTVYAKEVAGPSLIAPTGPQAGTIAVTIPENGRRSPRGDATWPNTAAGQNLPALDLLGASVYTSGSDLVAQIPVGDSSRSGMARDLASYNAVPQTTPPADRLQYLFRFSTAEDVFHLSMEYNSDGTVRFFGGKLDANDKYTNGTSTLGAGYHTDPAYPVVGSVRKGMITLRAPLAAFGLAVGSRITGANAFSMAGPSETLDLTIFDPMRTVDVTPPFDATLAPQTEAPSQVGCGDDNIQSEGGWHEVDDARATDGKVCRNVGSGKQADEHFQFTGTGLDVSVATGPRGSALDLTIDGVTQTIDLYRAAADPAHPDLTGRNDLTYVTIHRDVPAGIHSVQLSAHLTTTDPYRNMVYVNGVTISGGDILTPAGSTAREVATTTLGTALAGVGTVSALVIDAAASSIDVVMEATAGTTVTLKDPSGRTLATGTVDDGGVIDLHALPDGAGTYALVIQQSTAGDLAFTLWESVLEKQ